MKFGIGFANTGPFAAGPGAAMLGAAAEAAGFDSVWTVEHVVYPEGYESTYPYAPDGKMPGSGDNPIPDPLVWLAFVAATTSELTLATGISLLPERHPVTYAKEVATLDNLSGGRLQLGIGIGWLKEEFEVLGVPWERRAARTEEYVAVMRALWAADNASFDGEFVSFEGMSSNPKPTNRSVPITIGGHSRAAAERAGRIGNGFFPAKGDMAELVDIVRTTAVAHDRDPDAIEITGIHPGIFGEDLGGAVEEAASWGLHRLAVPSFMFFQNPEESIAAWGEKLAPHAG
jgi:probable F420-dependent oxidoreductase